MVLRVDHYLLSSGNGFLGICESSKFHCLLLIIFYIFTGKYWQEKCCSSRVDSVCVCTCVYVCGYTHLWNKTLDDSVFWFYANIYIWLMVCIIFLKFLYYLIRNLEVLIFRTQRWKRKICVLSSYGMTEIYISSCECGPQDPHDRREELTLISCPLASTCGPWYIKKSSHHKP